MKITQNILKELLNRTLLPSYASLCKAVGVRSSLLRIFIKLCINNWKKKELYVLVMKCRLGLEGSAKIFGHLNIMMLFLIFSLLVKQWVMASQSLLLFVLNKLLRASEKKIWNFLVHMEVIRWQWLLQVQF